MFPNATSPQKTTPLFIRNCLPLSEHFRGKKAEYFVDELLTESERIMIIKRFGAIFLYAQGYTPYRVSLTLGISHPTSYRLYEQYEAGDFDNMLGCMQKKDMHRFLTLMNDLIAAQASAKARARLMNRVL